MVPEEPMAQDEPMSPKELMVQEEPILNISTTNKRNENIENEKPTEDKKKKKVKKPTKIYKEKPEIVQIEPQRSFLFLSVSSGELITFSF